MGARTATCAASIARRNAPRAGKACYANELGDVCTGGLTTTTTRKQQSTMARNAGTFCQEEHVHGRSKVVDASG